MTTGWRLNLRNSANPTRAVVARHHGYTVDEDRMQCHKRGRQAESDAGHQPDAEKRSGDGHFDDGNEFLQEDSPLLMALYTAKPISPRVSRENPLQP